VNILVAEDDRDIADLIAHYLQKSGWHATIVGSGDEAVAHARANSLDLVILDVMLPGMSGLEVCRALRTDTTTAMIPIIMVTARAEETDRIIGLDIGADDYISKPFSPREVALRIRAVLRRAEPPPDRAHIREVGRIRLLVDAVRLEVDGREVPLTATEFRLLEHLMSRANRAQTRDTLLSEVWGYSQGVDSRTVDTHIRRLRRKLGSEADRIETVVGIGYRFRA